VENKVIKRIRNLEKNSHPPVDWKAEINRLAKRVKWLSKQINKRR